MTPEELKKHNEMVEAWNKKNGIDMSELLKQAMREAGYTDFIDVDGVTKPL